MNVHTKSHSYLFNICSDISGKNIFYSDVPVEAYLRWCCPGLLYVVSFHVIYLLQLLSSFFRDPPVKEIVHSVCASTALFLVLQCSHRFRDD